MLSGYDFELLAKNRAHRCKNDYTIYFSLSRRWELYDSNMNLVLGNLSYCPFCGEKLGKE